MNEHLADELDAKQGDESQWSQEPVEIQVKPTASQVVSFRMPGDEFDAMVEAAAASGQSISEFARDAIKLRLAAQTAFQAIRVTGKLSDWTRSTYRTSENQNPADPEPDRTRTMPITVAM